MRSVPGNLLFYSSVAGATAVMAGAFGAHSLGGVLPTDRLEIFETAVKYQAWHALALLALSALSAARAYSHLLLAGRFFVAGIFLFSGSLYFLSCRNLLGLEDWGAAGIITPFGGICFIAGWIILAIAAWRDAEHKHLHK